MNVRASIYAAVLVSLAGAAYGGEKEAIAAFKKTYSDESERIKAVEELGAVQHKLVVDTLVPLTKDPASSVEASGPQLHRPCSPRFEGEHPHDMEVAIINALGETGSDAAVPALVGFLVPKRHTRASAPAGEESSAHTGQALNALKKIGSSLAIEDLLEFLSKDAATRRKRRGSDPRGPLTKQADPRLPLSGEHFERILNEWRRWCDENDSLKSVPVYRCDETGKTFDRPTAATKCPHYPTDHPWCGGTFLRRFVGSNRPAREEPR